MLQLQVLVHNFLWRSWHQLGWSSLENPPPPSSPSLFPWGGFFCRKESEGQDVTKVNLKSLASEEKNFFIFFFWLIIDLIQRFCRMIIFPIPRSQFNCAGLWRRAGGLRALRRKLYFTTRSNMNNSLWSELKRGLKAKLVWCR